LNVTRLSWAGAAVWRAAARASLGSASSEIKLMERLLSFLSFAGHDCAD
jgi:hypothetical protein